MISNGLFSLFSYSNIVGNISNNLLTSMNIRERSLLMRGGGMGEILKISIFFSDPPLKISKKIYAPPPPKWSGLQFKSILKTSLIDCMWILLLKY